MLVRASTDGQSCISLNKYTISYPIMFVRVQDQKPSKEINLGILQLKGH